MEGTHLFSLFDCIFSKSVNYNMLVRMVVYNLSSLLASLDLVMLARQVIVTKLLIDIKGAFSGEKT